MMYVKHKLEIDLSGQAVMPRVDMVEGDQYARQLELSLLCGGERADGGACAAGAVLSGKRDTLRGADAGGR